MTRTFLIDTDGGSDDVVALIMALRSSAVRVRAITTVAGNVPVEQATRNVLYTVELCAAETPVFAGAERPLVKKLETAQWFHGRDGLGDHGYAPQRRRPDAAHAVDAIARTVLANPGLEIVTLGPLTNLALAIEREPKIVRAIGRLVVMGGAPCCEGNVTPAAEFNIWVDPEAAKMVFRAGLPIEMVGWHLCRGAAALNQQDIDRILALKTPVAEFAVRCNSVAAEAYHTQTGERGISLPDVPTTIEAGFPNSDYEFWVGAFAPAATPRTLVERLNQEIVKALGTSSVRERLNALGGLPTPITALAFADQFKREVDMNTRLVKAVGLQPN